MATTDNAALGHSLQALPQALLVAVSVPRLLSELRIHSFAIAGDWRGDSCANATETPR